jgi:hypothetical protein
MKAGQITAKLRDAVLVGFYEDGEEKAQYKNIDIPDSLKELDIMDFQFNVVPNGKITFRLFFEEGILPEVFPPIREKLTRAEMKAARATNPEVVRTEDLAEAAAEAIAAVADNGEVTVTPAEGDESGKTPEIPAEEMTPAIPEYRFNVTGDQRKALVKATADFLDVKPIYKAAPSFAFVIGAYTVDKTGTLIGEATPELLAALAEQGFTPEAE